jgi:hypothetical protein
LVSPFEAGAAIEMSQKFSLGLEFYEPYAFGNIKDADHVLVQFARQRWLMSKIGFVGILPTKDRRRRQNEDEYKRKARDWRIEWTKLARFPDLNPYDEAISAFYSVCGVKPLINEPHNIANTSIEVPSSCPEAEPADPHELGVTEREVPIESNRLATSIVAVGPANELSTDEDSIVRHEGALQKQAVSLLGSVSIDESGLIQKLSESALSVLDKNDEIFTAAINGRQWQIACYFGVGRVQIQDSHTKYEVVLKRMSSGLSVQSLDVEVAPMEVGEWKCGTWPLKVAIRRVDSTSDDQDVEIIFLPGRTAFRFRL